MVLALIALFEQVGNSEMPIVLGRLGTVITLLGMVALAVLNVLQYRQRLRVDEAKRETDAARNETSHWMGTANAYEKELGVVRERCNRLEADNQEIAKHIGELQAKTDLKPLMEIQERVATVLQDLSTGSADRYMKAMDVITKNTDAIGTLEKHMTREFAQNRKALKKVTTAFEKKMNGQTGQ